MPEIEQVLNSDDFKSKAAAVGAGVLVIIAGFLVYNYFSKVGKEGELYGEPAIEEQVTEESENPITVGEKPEDAGESTNISKETQEATAPGAEKATTATSESAEWKATDYQVGDVSGDEYTIKKGDTLWEIAEARYGSGFEWEKILSANKDKIGFLPNGSQALIEVGQTLILP